MYDFISLKNYGMAESHRVESFIWMLMTASWPKEYTEEKKKVLINYVRI